MRIVNVAILIVLWVGFSSAQELPAEWIDPDTDHRVIRLSKEYDLQTPRSQVFWVAGRDTVTGARVQYYVPRAEWSVHFNVLPDGNYLFHPEELPASALEPNVTFSPDMK